MGGKWPHNGFFKERFFQDLFNIAHNILFQFPSSFFLGVLVV